MFLFSKKYQLFYVHLYYKPNNAIFEFQNLFVTFFYNSANSEVINKIEVIGNERISLETIVVFGDISIGKDYDTSDVNLLIKKLNILNKIQIKSLLLNFSPELIIYLAGQSSPAKSFLKKRKPI